MRKLILILTLFFFEHSFSQNACFTVDPSSGCPPLTISVTDCSTGSSTDPVYYYTGVLANEFESSDTFYTYTEPGNHTIYQKITAGSTNYVDSLTINVWPIPRPTITLSNCDNNEVHLEIENTGYDYFVINWDDGSPFDTIPASDITHSFGNSTTRNITIYGRYSPEHCGNDTIITITPIQSFEKSNIDTLRVMGDSAIKLSIVGQAFVPYEMSTEINGVPSSMKEINTQNSIFYDTITGVNPTTDVYCFDFIAQDKCAASTVPTSASDKVCSVILNGTSQPGFNEMNWDAYTGDNTPTYNLNRNNTLLQSFATNQNPYNDSAIFCSQGYNYQLLTSTSSAISFSNIVNVVGQSESSPKAVENVFSTYNTNNELEISWNSPSRIPPQFYTMNSTQVTDTFLVINSIEKRCYDITYTDSCGNVSQVSEETCPIILEAQQNSIFEIELNWSNYFNFANGLNFNRLYIYDNEKQLISTIDNGTSTNYIFDVEGEINQIYYFRVEGVSNDSISTFSNEVELVLNNRIAVPNAFSPNNDGLNDIFIPKVRFVKEYRFSIYNKWGTSLFSTDNRNEGWGGNNAPPGVYSYIIEVTDYLGEEIVKKGTVTLIK